MIFHNFECSINIILVTHRYREANSVYNDICPNLNKEIDLGVKLCFIIKKKEMEQTRGHIEGGLTLSHICELSFIDSEEMEIPCVLIILKSHSKYQGKAFPSHVCSEIIKLQDWKGRGTIINITAQFYHFYT